MISSNRWLPVLKEKYKDVDEKIFSKAANDLFTYSTFIFKAESFRLDEFPISNKVYSEHLKGAKRVLVEIGTLSIGFDYLLIKCKALSNEYALLLNSMANFLLEAMMDSQQPPYRVTYRFGVGYQGTPISDLKPLVHLMNMDNVISFTDTGFMKPIKTIVGFRGILL